MMIEGTVVNGVIVLAGGARLPEGVRIRVELDDPDDLAPPIEPYDREQELAILREAQEDVRAGRDIEARQLLKELAEEHNLPLTPGESSGR
jgi:hypothetical protein